MAVDPLTNGELLMEYRCKHLMAQQAALEVLEAVDKEYGELFGRSYGGAIEEYRSDDADYILITCGSVSGAAKDAVDLKRAQGIKAGLVRIRWVRPFPQQRIRKALAGVKAIAVVDKSVSFGWNSGILSQEVRGALYDQGKAVPFLSVIGGLGGEDVSVSMMQDVIDRMVRAAGESFESPLWLMPSEY
jgi:pyruvate ferredoxin oxidoreductase alpha subunit/phenylglyoxylate dehydrogenase alpha subunit